MIRFGRKIPITIYPFFWVIAGLIGWIYSSSLVGMLIWIGIIFISVLIHEMGHALTAIFFGKKPKIDFIAMGGVTSYQVGGLSYGKQFLIVFNGPLFGVFLACAAWGLSFFFVEAPLAFRVLKVTMIVNIFWSVVNLFPVLPLDGGQLLRIAMEGWLGIRGLKLSFLIGMLISLAFALFFFAWGAFLLGALFFLFAFQSYDTWKKTKGMSEEDRDEHLKKMVMMAESALKAGREEEGEELLHSVKDQTKKGMLHTVATEYLAKIAYNKGNKKEAYEMLRSIEDHLSDDALCLLHDLAYENKNYPLVVKLSSLAFQHKESQKVALYNAYAYASQGEAEPAGGWLKKAYQMGGFPLENVLKDPLFDKVRNNPRFQSYIKDIKA